MVPLVLKWTGLGMLLWKLLYTLKKEPSWGNTERGQNFSLEPSATRANLNDISRKEKRMRECVKETQEASLRSSELGPAKNWL